jgi:glucoamylase
LVAKVIVDQYTMGEDSSLGRLINDLVSAQADIQQISNPSGTVSTGGLGEPKVGVAPHTKLE